VAPLGDVGPDLRAGLKDEGFQAAVEQVGGGGQADRAGADHHHRQAGVRGGSAVGVLGRERLVAVVAGHRRLLKAHRLTTVDV
jgi:hypothetical protein